MISEVKSPYKMIRKGSHWVISFSAMASPCEVLVRSQDKSEVEHLASLSFSETQRIEYKFSRYRPDSIVSKINSSNGHAVQVDEELKRLLDYAEQCYELSGGLFDITSGILRKAWKFDGSTVTPDSTLIQTLRDRIGWDKVKWSGTEITLQPGMEIDLGGIGKEYAVDIVAELLFREAGETLMVNFGGDIRAITADKNAVPWIVGIEDIKTKNTAVGQIDLINGGVATSGEAKRFCIVNGRRLCHILNPKTGWPQENSPKSVTVIGNYCAEAGILATMAMLQGSNAEKFLEQQGVTSHCIR